MHVFSSPLLAGRGYTPQAKTNQPLIAGSDGQFGSCCGAEEGPRADEVMLSCAAEVSSMRPTAPRDEAYRQHLGLTLWERFQDGKIDLLPVQVSGRNDGADARSNIADTALGRQAKRSSYQNAPGGRVSLSFPLLEGLKTLSDTHTYRVTALAGGSHSARSRHYLGVGFDIDQLDGMPVNKDHPGFRDFMAKAREMGATEVLGPGHGGHDNHIHVSWPREAAG
jgi:hypothetical protein